MSSRLEGKVVVVTGAGRGIGRNIAKLFQDHGATVVGCDRKADMFNTDLSHPYAGKLLMQEVIAKHGRVDVLVNNARSSDRLKLFEEDEEAWSHEMNVSLKSAYFLAKYAIQNMQGGAIVNIGSVTSNFVSHESGAYQIAKGACAQMTRVLALAGRHNRVRCNAVLPGFIVQDEHRARYNQPDNVLYRSVFERLHMGGRVGTSDDVAKAVLWLASDDSEFVNGASLVVDGGLTIQEPASSRYEEMRS